MSADVNKNAPLRERSATLAGRINLIITLMIRMIRAATNILYNRTSIISNMSIIAVPKYSTINADAPSKCRERPERREERMMARKF